MISHILDARGPALPSVIPSVVVLVRLGSGEEVLRCIGGAGAPAAADQDTVFQVMSISKPVTAFGALRLAHLGQLDLDAPVVDLLKSWTFPPDRTSGFDPRAITVRRILCHAAGLNVHGYGWVEPGASHPTPADLLDGRGWPDIPLQLVGAPGALALYSGGGYLLLQQVIEDVTGRPFAAVMRESVFEPLGMTRSTFDHADSILADLATRHDDQGSPLPPARIAAAAVSGLYSTARDLTRFLTALSPGPDARPPGSGLISPQAAEQMTSTQATDAQGRGWSLGFYMLQFPAGTIFHHGGLKTGWWSQIDGVAGAGHTIVTLTNGDASDVHVKPIVAELRQLLLAGSGSKSSTTP